MHILKGRYVSHNGGSCGADGSVSKNWEGIVAAHKDEFPAIQECIPGTFNVWITKPENYLPPSEQKYRKLSAEHWNREKGHHISPVAKVTMINGIDVECWIYRGGHEGQPVLELLSKEELETKLGVQPGKLLTLELEILPEGALGMPAVPGPLLQ